VTPQIIAPDHAVRLRARQDLLDKDGIHRATGEEWLVRDIGAYLPGVFEEVGQWHGLTAGVVTVQAVSAVLPAVHSRPSCQPSVAFGVGWEIWLVENNRVICSLLMEKKKKLGGVWLCLLSWTEAAW